MMQRRRIRIPDTETQSQTRIPGTGRDARGHNRSSTAMREASAITEVDRSWSMDELKYLMVINTYGKEMVDDLALYLNTYQDLTPDLLSAVMSNRISIGKLSDERRVELSQAGRDLSTVQLTDRIHELAQSQTIQWARNLVGVFPEGGTITADFSARKFKVKKLDSSVEWTVEEEGSCSIAVSAPDGETRVTPEAFRDVSLFLANYNVSYGTSPKAMPKKSSPAEIKLWSDHFGVTRLATKVAGIRAPVLERAIQNQRPSGVPRMLEVVLTSSAVKLAYAPSVHKALLEIGDKVYEGYGSVIERMENERGYAQKLAGKMDISALNAFRNIRGAHSNLTNTIAKDISSSTSVVARGASDFLKWSNVITCRFNRPCDVFITWGNDTPNHWSPALSRIKRSKVCIETHSSPSSMWNLLSDDVLGRVSAMVNQVDKKKNKASGAGRVYILSRAKLGDKTDDESPQRRAYDQMFAIADRLSQLGAEFVIAFRAEPEPLGKKLSYARLFNIPLRGKETKKPFSVTYHQEYTRVHNGEIIMVLSSEEFEDEDLQGQGDTVNIGLLAEMYHGNCTRNALAFVGQHFALSERDAPSENFHPYLEFLNQEKSAQSASSKEKELKESDKVTIKSRLARPVGRKRGGVNASTTSVSAAVSPPDEEEEVEDSTEAGDLDSDDEAHDVIE